MNELPEVRMGNSLRLLRVKGIDIRVHITFPLILVWAAIQFGWLNGLGMDGAIFGIIVTLLLFSIVVLHELGHSLAALRYGVPVKQIVLLPIGGVAQLARMPEKPAQEFVIAIAGPLVNVALALVFAIIAPLAGFTLTMGSLSENILDLARASMSSIFAYVFISNLFLAGFNLLPAFPMDGGRILRAILAARMSYPRATAIAVTIGQALAWLLGLYGFLGGGFFIVLIAIFIFVGASQEGQLVQLRSVLGSLQVEQAYSRQAQTLSPESTLNDVVELTLNSFQADFPVCDGSSLVGIITHSRLIQTLNKYPPETLVRDVMVEGIPYVSPDEGLFEVQKRFSEYGVDALPVVDQGRFLGIITSKDLNEIYQLLSRKPDLLSASNAIVKVKA
jgi:Zn-dependent protease/CBS domain-containing protein